MVKCFLLLEDEMCVSLDAISELKQWSNANLPQNAHIVKHLRILYNVADGWQYDASPYYEKYLKDSYLHV